MKAKCKADIYYLNERRNIDSAIDHLLRKGYNLDKFEEHSNSKVSYMSQYFVLRDDRGTTQSYIALDMKLYKERIVEFQFVELL